MTQLDVGFTGTQRGMTLIQQSLVAEILMLATHARHGDCVGSDAEFHEIAKRMLVPVTVHPPIEPSKRAWCEGYAAIVEPAEYLKRNKSIVRVCDVLVATPKLMQPEMRSGTWATVRYAMRLGRRVIIVWPDGSIGMN